MYGDKIAEVVRTLIKINKSVIQSVSANIDRLRTDNHIAYAKEYKTVKVSACRRGGHSHSVGKIAYDMFHDGNKVLVVHPKAGMAVYFKKSYPELDHLCIVKPASILTQRGYQSCEVPDLSGVIIDVASMVSSSKMDGIYRLYAKIACLDDDFFFVLLE